MDWQDYEGALAGRRVMGECGTEWQRDTPALNGNETGRTVFSEGRRQKVLVPIQRLCQIFSASSVLHQVLVIWDQVGPKGWARQSSHVVGVAGSYMASSN